jgi:preprotein translocase subunit YajC
MTVEALGSLVPFLLIALVFWLLLVRPQRRRALELDRIQRGLTVGDEVLLGSGIVATVADLPAEDEFLGVEVSPGVRVRVARGAVARILEPSPARAAAEEAVDDHDTDPPTTDLTKH